MQTSHAIGLVKSSGYRLIRRSSSCSSIRRLCFVAFVLCCGRTSNATDYFLTIGGGYSPAGNQASLEANVIFLQSILKEQHRGERVEEVYFADGFDSTADLQVQLPPTESALPATALLTALHRRGRAGDGERLSYRNHLVPRIAGASDPTLIEASLEGIARKAETGDRVIIYVTSHGSEGPRDDPFNTTIDCWNKKAITVRELSGWLNALPSDVPVIMVMAQCYCGGFAQVIFERFGGEAVDDEQTEQLSSHLRTGFFAQQHNLEAAGCRPDISNDEEFSSYFWGAIAGRSRTGAAITGCDLDNNGNVSFAEAYAHAVVASNTIDIPLRASDVLLKTYSRMAGDDDDAALKNVARANEKALSDNDTPSTKSPVDVTSSRELASLAGTLESLIENQDETTKRIVMGLCEELQISLKDDVTVVVKAFDDQRSHRRPPERGRRRSSSGRRELLAEIGEKWPELANPEEWEQSSMLKASNQETLLKEIQELPAFAVYDERRIQRAELAEQAKTNELREVKFRRLFETLNIIVLARNLPLVASPEVVRRYRDMLILEDYCLKRG